MAEPAGPAPGLGGRHARPAAADGTPGLDSREEEGQRRRAFWAPKALCAVCAKELMSGTTDTFEHKKEWRFLYK